jgi:hypothetical protein
MPFLKPLMAVLVFVWCLRWTIRGQVSHGRALCGYPTRHSCQTNEVFLGNDTLVSSESAYYQSLDSSTIQTSLLDTAHAFRLLVLNWIFGHVRIVDIHQCLGHLRTCVQVLA